MTTKKPSKAATLFATAGIVGGIFYSYKKNDPMQKILISAGIFGICGYLVGSAITKLYE
jgi:hypothetical protein